MEKIHHRYLIKQMQDNIVSFVFDQQHHIINVMRNKVGSQVIGVFDHQQYLCEIISIEPLRAKVLEHLIVDVKNNFVMNVYQASIKPAAMDLAITKACELNANHFYIFNAEFSQKNIVHNMERYQKLIINACQQCNRTDLMSLTLIKNNIELNALLDTNDTNLIADFTTQSSFLNDIISNSLKIGIIIGPEGGWTKNDFDYLKNEKNHIINLTKTILRAETATMYLLSIISYIKLGA